MCKSTASPGPLDRPSRDPVGAILGVELARHLNVEAVTFEWAAVAQVISPEGRISYHSFSATDAPDWLDMELIAHATDWWRGESDE